MRLSIDHLSIMDHLTSDAAGAARVDLELRGKKSSVVRVYYPNGGERIRLEWNEDHELTPVCNEKVLRALRDDAYLTAVLMEVTTEDVPEELADVPPVGMASVGHRAAPPTMFI